MEEIHSCMHQHEECSHADKACKGSNLLAYMRGILKLGHPGDFSGLLHTSRGYIEDWRSRTDGLTIFGNGLLQCTLVMHIERNLVFFFLRTEGILLLWCYFGYVLCTYCVCSWLDVSRVWFILYIGTSLANEDTWSFNISSEYSQHHLSVLEIIVNNLHLSPFFIISK